LAVFFDSMRLDIATAEYTLAPLSTFDPSTDFSDDPVVRNLQECVLAESKRFVARLSIRRGDECRLVWEVETDELDAKAAVLADIEKQAAPLGFHFSDLVEVLAVEFRIEEGQALVLALALTFPRSLVRAGMHLADDRPRGRGRPRQVDQRTHAVSLLAEGWVYATGLRAGTAEHALFVRALDVAKDALPLRRRADEEQIEQMRKFLRTEAKKIRSKTVRFIAPLNSLAELSRPASKGN
jgi:hypothetical protein